MLLKIRSMAIVLFLIVLFLGSVYASSAYASSSENSIIGKWLIINEDGGMWYLEFYDDGTFLGTNRYIGLDELQNSITSGHNSLSNGESGEWIQEDDVIRCQRENGKAYHWALNGDAMNGFEIYLDGHRNPVSAERIGEGEFFPEEK